MIITDVQVHQATITDPDQASEKNKYLVDFRIKNKGGEDVLVNKIQFEVLDIVSLGIKGHLT
ncbi:MAG: hypothetical protein MJE63_17990 [Proteobacteria bacterium]|nr:hypothetical protein [Pseudomonadota bacterium]